MSLSGRLSASRRITVTHLDQICDVTLKKGSIYKVLKTELKITLVIFYSKKVEVLSDPLSVTS